MDQDTGYQCVVDVNEFLKYGQDFDYIIVGGGTAGLVLASRLSEDPSVRVAVLEAGGSHLNDPKILTPGHMLSLLKDEEYDWDYTTVPQQANGKVDRLPRGKGLGGSSSINWFFWGRMSRGEFDPWEKIGGEAWSWDRMWPYMLKVECADKEALEIRDGEFARVLGNYGAQGNIRISQPEAQFPYMSSLREAIAASGLLSTSELADNFGGNNQSYYEALNSIDRSLVRGSRSYAVTGYLKSIKHRENLRILTNAVASKVILSDGEQPTATGVLFDHGGKSYQLNAKREVIVCAGSFESPKLLELSGIGNPEILEPLGIKVAVENRAVGEYLQDHVVYGHCYELALGEVSADMFKNPELASSLQKEYDESGTGVLAGASNIIHGISAAHLGNAKNLDALLALIKEHQAEDEMAAEIRDHQMKNLVNTAGMDLAILPLATRVDWTKAFSYAELMGPPFDGKCYFTVCCQLRRSFSLGNTHITTKDPHVRPRIDPKFLTHPVDLAMMVKGSQALDKTLRSEPIAKKLGKRTFPAEDINLQDAEAARKDILEYHNTELHPCGTVGMGRVVDGELKVLGVRGLRVVDASIFPVLPTSNTQSIVYAVAERAADLIKNSRAA